MVKISIQSLRTLLKSNLILDDTPIDSYKLKNTLHHNCGFKFRAFYPNTVIPNFHVND